ncbi:hypothetical protein HPB51_011474 [Rhipicephalus microplus]|uniref:Uncharacterized protein n=1 Tax=Rhipicephalus microplus TaxID=6941 RepID=A0A9J6E1A6_RHIMP|nr:hypothetical protein HPB51_011474 [Rhipicephalus microplus]
MAGQISSPLSFLHGPRDPLAALSIRYGLRCAREVDPDISLPDIKERRCKNDDPQDFPRKFYQCWNRLLDTDELLTRVGFTGDELDRFRAAALSEFSKRYEEYCARKIAPQMSVSELHVHRCADKQFNRLLSEISKRYEEYCARKIAPQMSVSELQVHRCADKQFNKLHLPQEHV